MPRRLLDIAAVVCVWSVISASSVVSQEPYLNPPAVVEKILDAPRLPALIPSPDGRVVLLPEPPTLPGIADLAHPMLRLAGLRINPNTNGPHSPLAYKSRVFRALAASANA